jgi:hypothetical protein
MWLINADLDEDFEIKCRKCGSPHVVIANGIRSCDDGGGYIDTFGDLSLRCSGCGNSADIISK